MQGYLIKQRYLETALSGGDLDQLDKTILAEGALPVAITGQLMLAKIRRDCSELAQKLVPLCEGEPQRLEVNIAFPNLVLQGWLDHCYPAHLLRYRPAEVNARDRLSSWVEHLALCLSSGQCRNTVYRGLSGKVHYRAVEKEQAYGYLKTLVEFYQQGMNAPQAFDASCAREYLKQSQKDPDKAEQLIETLFYGNAYKAGLQDDPYLRRAYPDYAQFSAQFIPLADAIYAPMLDYIEEGKDD